MRQLTKLALSSLFAGMLAAPALAEDGVTATEIILGSHTALSGPVSAWGVGSTEGTRLRFDEANEKGIHGRKIKFVVEDNQYQVPRAVQAANKLINSDKIFLMIGALGTPMNNAVLGEQLAKGVPNLFPFTAARSMAEPLHKLKFAQFSTYYDQVRASIKHFTEKEGKRRSARCTRTRISATRSVTRCATRPRPRRQRSCRKPPTARPTRTSSLPSPS
jgi:branched-chain amino acid transport system substrate-binding protein